MKNQIKYQENATYLINKVKVGLKIGQGSFGTVYEGVDEETGKKVAIKFEPRSWKVPKLLEREYRIYKKLDAAGKIIILLTLITLPTL